MVKLYGTDITIYTPEDARNILGVSATQVSRLCASLGAPQLGKFYLINDELLAAMKERKGKRVGLKRKQLINRNQLFDMQEIVDIILK